tara:strand:+ start:415 stop:1428 length:1014 start_codon:yes stop_codon:yes gene_type:complete
MIHAYAALKPGDPLQPYAYDPGELGDHQVEIDVAYCGICHSDISMIDNAWGMSEYPIVPGHEVAGYIAKVGKKVTHFKVGDRVGLGWHAGYCNHCEYCEDGDANLCQQAQPTIVKHHGGFANKVRADWNSVVLIPKDIELEYVGPFFCGGITVFNPLIQYNIQPKDRVAVIGIGGLGHMALAFLNQLGCEVTAMTSSPEKHQEALDLGAHHTLDSTNHRDMEAHQHEFDLIISTVNVKLDWNLFLSTLKPKGRLHFVGATLEPLDVSVFALIAAQRQISGSPVGSPKNIALMLDFIQAHHIKPAIEIFEMKDVNTAIQKLRDGQIRYRAVLKNTALE